MSRLETYLLTCRNCNRLLVYAKGVDTEKEGSVKFNFNTSSGINDGKYREHLRMCLKRRKSSFYITSTVGEPQSTFRYSLKHPAYNMTKKYKSRSNIGIDRK